MLEKLKNELEAVAFMLVDDASRKDIHAKLIQCLVLVEQLRGGAIERIAAPNQVSVVDEVNKVQRRLRLWAKRQDQYNARILNAFLELKRKGKVVISEQDIYRQAGSPVEFASNFSQMKIIAERNHGKVFDVLNDEVTIWPPVASAVAEYEQMVFGRG